MSWYRCDISSGGGGGPITPTFTETLICDNSSVSNTLTFTGDWHGYDFLKFKLSNSSSGIITYITATPDMVDNIFLYSSNLILFNEYKNNQYAVYKISSDPLVWNRAYQRNMDVVEVKGLNANNCTVNQEFIYCKQGISLIKETIIAPHDFDTYDEIYAASCTGATDETMPSYLPTHSGCGSYSIYNGDRTLLTVGNEVVETSEGWESRNLFYLVGINYT